MASPQRTHERRERQVLSDLEISFADFSGRPRSWASSPQGQDPPDFISRDHGAIGLELVEWLDGDQMGPAKARESQRDQIRRVLAQGCENLYQPQHFRGAFPSPRQTERIARGDETLLRQEFIACAADVDRTWDAIADPWSNSYYQTEFPGYSLLGTYFGAIRYIGGEPHGLCWIGEQGDGGAYDPNVAAKTLQRALETKLIHYARPEKQMHFKTHDLTELNLLVHGSFNVYAYNKPAGRLSLEEIARRGAEYYASLAQRHVFNRVWFFHSLDTADDLNQSLGFAPGEGRVRWLAELWPNFRIYSGSLSGSD